MAMPRDPWAQERENPFSAYSVGHTDGVEEALEKTRRAQAERDASHAKQLEYARDAAHARGREGAAREHRAKVKEIVQKHHDRMTKAVNEARNAAYRDGVEAGSTTDRNAIRQAEERGRIAGRSAAHEANAKLSESYQRDVKTLQARLEKEYEEKLAAMGELSRRQIEAMKVRLDAEYGDNLTVETAKLSRAYQRDYELTKVVLEKDLQAHKDRSEKEYRAALEEARRNYIRRLDDTFANGKRAAEREQEGKLKAERERLEQDFRERLELSESYWQRRLVDKQAKSDESQRNELWFVQAEKELIQEALKEALQGPYAPNSNHLWQRTMQIPHSKILARANMLEAQNEEDRNR